MKISNPFARGRAWHVGTLVGFDLETTGVDTTTDRVVTAAVVHVARSGRVLRARQWLVDPGVRIPPAATAVHGISTEWARTAGRPARAAVAEIIQELESAWRAGLPVVIFNAPYDLTLLDAEAVRYGLPRLADRPWFASARVIDPLVIDRGVDPYRRGKRTLVAAAEHYGVVPWDAHSASGDAIAAVAVARAIAARFELVEGADTQTLHSAQIGWHQGWSAELQAYLRSRGNSQAVIDRAWPLRPPVVGRHRAPEAGQISDRTGRHRRAETTGQPSAVDNVPHLRTHHFAA